MKEQAKCKGKDTSQTSGNESETSSSDSEFSSSFSESESSPGKQRTKSRPTPPCDTDRHGNPTQEKPANRAKEYAVPEGIKQLKDMSMSTRKMVCEHSFWRRKKFQLMNIVD